MADPILFQEFIFHDWPWGGDTGSLLIFDDARWTDENGVARGANPARDLEQPFQRVEVLIEDRIATVGPFIYMPTVNAIDNPFVTRTGVFYDADDSEHYTLFSGATFPAEPNPMNWAEFVRYNSKPLQPRMQDRYYTADDLWRIIGERMVKQNGIAIMAEGVAVVPAVFVTASSLIKVWSQSNGVSGVLRVIARDVGETFTVISSNGGDEGEIAWEITEPIPLTGAFL